MPSIIVATQTKQAVADEAHKGLIAPRKSLPPWLVYDTQGSQLFEQITKAPEYYLSRIERSILRAHADEILRIAANCRPLSILELGCGSASKSGILLSALARHQVTARYQPVDVSKTALDLAQRNIQKQVSGVAFRPQIANYTCDPLKLERWPCGRILAVYLGSSIGNFTPAESQDLLSNLHAQLQKGDSLLLGADLVKNEQTMTAAYNDASGITAAFNRNVLARLNRELGANFDIENFDHKVIWNKHESRIEMHLRSVIPQRVRIPAGSNYPEQQVDFREDETIHTESSYKFTFASISALLQWSGFSTAQTWYDTDQMFALTLATVN